MSGGKTVEVSDLVERFEFIHNERMKGLPIVNARLRVEAVGFRDFDDKRLGVLITPWFMNLILLEHRDTWLDLSQGDTIRFRFPHGPIEFAVTHDDDLGSFLSAVLFRTMSDMPDQETARDLASEIMSQLFIEPSENEGALTRRELFTGLRAT